MKIRDTIRKELNVGDLATLRGYDHELIIFCVVYVGLEGFVGLCLSHRTAGMMEKYFKHSDDCPYSFRITYQAEINEHREILESLRN